MKKCYRSRRPFAIIYCLVAELNPLQTLNTELSAKDGVYEAVRLLLISPRCLPLPPPPLASAW